MMADWSYLYFSILALLQYSSCATDNTSASEIASSIISAVCESSDSDVLEFYRSVKSSYESIQDEQYPLLGKDQSTELASILH